MLAGLLAVLGLMHRPKPDAAERAQLTAREEQIAVRLSKLTGQTRDDILASAHRKADRITADYAAAEQDRLARGRR